MLVAWACWATAAVPMVEPPQTTTLDNGLRVILQVDRRSERAAVAIGYDVGQEDDPARRAELAHLVEHVTFRRSAGLGELGSFDYYQRAGVTFNGFTYPSETIYLSAGPVSELDRLLWVEAERMANFRPQASDVEAEARVVIAEAKERSGFGQQLRDALYQRLLPPSLRLPDYEAEVADVKRLDREDIAWLHATYYRPENAVLTVVSPLDVDAMADLVRRRFGGIQSSSAPRSTPPAASAACPTGWVRLRSWYRSPRVGFMWRLDEAPPPVVAEVATDLLRRRMYHGWEDKKNKPKRVRWYDVGERSMMLVVHPKPEDWEADTYEKELQRQLKREVTQRNVDFSRKMLRFGALRNADKLDVATEMTRRALRREPYGPAYVERLDAVTPDDVREFFDDVLSEPELRFEHRFEKGRKEMKADGVEVCRS
jgi:predicted Zn-dependent peptidase